MYEDALQHRIELSWGSLIPHGGDWRKAAEGVGVNHLGTWSDHDFGVVEHDAGRMDMCGPRGSWLLEQTKLLEPAPPHSGQTQLVNDRGQLPRPL